MSFIVIQKQSGQAINYWGPFASVEDAKAWTNRNCRCGPFSYTWEVPLLSDPTDLKGFKYYEPK